MGLYARDLLIKLSNSGYIASYLTNHLLNLKEIIDLASRERLCDELPVLIVTEELRHHSQISFTTKSDHFLLHSDEFKLQKSSIKKILKNIKPSRLTQDIKTISKLLLDYESSGVTKSKLQMYLSKVDNLKQGIVIKYLILKHLLLIYLDIHWVRIPKR